MKTFMPATNIILWSGCSLVGKDTALAIEKGLAEATQYLSRQACRFPLIMRQL